MFKLLLIVVTISQSTSTTNSGYKGDVCAYSEQEGTRVESCNTCTVTKRRPQSDLSKCAGMAIGGLSITQYCGTLQSGITLTTTGNCRYCTEDALHTCTSSSYSASQTTLVQYQCIQANCGRNIFVTLKNLQKDTKLFGRNSRAMQVKEFSKKFFQMFEAECFVRNSNNKVDHVYKLNMSRLMAKPPIAMPYVAN